MKDVYVSEKVDVYHLGTFFYKLLQGDYPYQYESYVGLSQSNEDFLLGFVLNEEYLPFLPKEEGGGEGGHNEFVGVMRNAMEYDSRRRESAEVISRRLVDLYRRYFG